MIKYSKNTSRHCSVSHAAILSKQRPHIYQIIHPNWWKEMKDKQSNFGHGGGGGGGVTPNIYMNGSLK